ncbi:hypothetical protein ABFV80_001535 [Vandammella animalimorsus]|uniref:hypothetical protein n=1 Tax=Vandammella animalimorsus TaxID=2029117 RepID=UPI00325A8334
MGESGGGKMENGSAIANRGCVHGEDDLDAELPSAPADAPAGRAKPAGERAIQSFAIACECVSSFEPFGPMRGFGAEFVDYGKCLCTHAMHQCKTRPG